MSKAQFIGFSGQYADGAKGQFVANLAFPTYHKENALKLINMSGLEYSTSGGAELSGLNIKPVQLVTYFGDEFYNNNPVTLLLGVDAGYLFDFRKNRKNSIVITPNFYADYKFFFVKAGYDVDTFHGKNQFFVRAGIGVGLGTFKIFTNTKIR